MAQEQTRIDQANESITDSLARLDDAAEAQRTQYSGTALATPRLYQLWADTASGWMRQITGLSPTTETALWRLGQRPFTGIPIQLDLDYTVLDGDANLVHIDSTTATRTVTLPDATTNPGELVMVAQFDNSNPSIVAAAGTDKIDGRTDQDDITLRHRGDFVALVSTGSNELEPAGGSGANGWWILSMRVAGVVSISALYTVKWFDKVVLANGTFTVTLPPAADMEGDSVTIKNVGSGTVTIDGDGSETIDGATTVAMSTQYHFRTIVSDGSNWSVIGTN